MCSREELGSFVWSVAAVLVLSEFSCLLVLSKLYRLVRPLLGWFLHRCGVEFPAAVQDEFRRSGQKEVGLALLTSLSRLGLFCVLFPRWLCGF